jgi:two-component system, NtrC family, nitrogen regulation sensor histidine kinase NtrY
MTLALRLLISLGLLSLVATGVVGVVAREAWRRAEEQQFDDQLQAARKGVLKELQWEASQMGDALRAKCAYDAYIDQTLVELAGNEITTGRRLALSELVPQERKALHLDELVLFTGSGEILGSGDDPAAPGTTDPSLASDLTNRPDFEFRPAGPNTKAALVTRCSRKLGSHTVGLLGARHLDSTLSRIGEAYGVKLSIAPLGLPEPDAHEARLLVEAPSRELLGLRVMATISKRPLEARLDSVDDRIVFASAVTVGIAAIAAILLARSLARPLEALARQAGEVVRGDPRPVQARGGPEIEAFAHAFNRAIEDLVQLRKRLAVTERIAARREIARVVAHEIKNPLAPIRAAVETLRRLRARQDPAFDEYFDEATRTVLEQVHRITKIVSEFTEFARLPAPHPTGVRLDEVVKSTVALYATGGDEVSAVVTEGLVLQADRDQLVQVLTNLVQNALDAARGREGKPRVIVQATSQGTDRVAITVTDNGPGVSNEMLPRLFQAYATSKPDGTGLGLAIVQRIVNEHGGEIVYERAPQGGAVFRVLLPVGGPALLPAHLEPPSGELPRG